MRRRGTRAATALALLLVGLQTGALPTGDPAAAAPGSPPVAAVAGAVAGVPTPPNGMLGFNHDGDYEVFWPGDPTAVPVFESDDEDAGLRYHDPAWAPDGRTVAMIQSIEGVRTVALRDWSGRMVAELGPWPGGELTDVWWSGGSDKLLVAERMPDGRFVLWQVDIDGGKRHQVAVVAEPLDDATISPDGSSLAYLRRVEDGSQVVRHDIAEGTSTVILSHSWPMYDVAWSPDGTTVAAVVGAGLWLVAPDGSDARQVVDSEEHRVGHVAWSPDSRLVGFTAASVDVSVAALDVASGVVVPLLGQRWNLRHLTWQPLPACSVTGTDADDVLVGGRGDDVICAGEGDDVVRASPGADIVLGAGGTDRIDHTSSDAGVVVDLGSSWAGTASGATMIVAVEDVTGSPFDDHLVGGSEDNFLAGGRGADLLVGSGGADAVLGGRGVDTVSFNLRQAFATFDRTTVDVDLVRGTAVGKDGHTDTLRRVENVVGSGGPDVVRGDDSANLLVAAHRRAVIEGRGGQDTLHTKGLVTYEHAPGPVVVDAVDYRAVTVTGADGADHLRSYSALRGSAYDDVLSGSLGHVEGGGGDDLITPSWLDDVDGGPGTDTLDASLLGHGVDVRPGDDATPGRWFRSGTTGRTQFRLTGFEEFRLSDKRDRFGADGPDGYRVDAFAGHDTVSGGGGGDVIRGGPGDDVVTGGDGSDRLRPGAGDDDVDGGPGQDHCARTPSDVVRRCEARLGAGG